MSSGPSYFRQAYFKWKSLKLPWRRQFLIGADLAGNTFWEFRDALNAGRWRRIVKFSRKTHIGDVKLSPQWHQWLRHTRDQAPSIQEQQYDVSRQAMMKQLAHEADERWKSTPSFLDAPNKQQPAPATNIHESKPPSPPQQSEDQKKLGDSDGDDVVESSQEEVTAAASQAPDESKDKGSFKPRREKKENPWQKAEQGAPSENWQPAKWSPGVAQRR